MQLLADAAAGGQGRETVKIPDDVAEFTYKTTGGENAGYFLASVGNRSLGLLPKIFKGLMFPLLASSSVVFFFFPVALFPDRRS